MNQAKYFIALVLFVYIESLEEPEYINKLNDFQTISDNQHLKIKVEKESILYLDSIDGQCLAYYNTNQRADGIFWIISANKVFELSTSFYSNAPSTIIRYLFPYDLSTEEINIKDNSISHLYLRINRIFTLNFENNSIKRMIVLSQRTLKTTITIRKNNENFILNKDNLFYEIDKDFKGKLTLQINDYSAFIHFLTGFEQGDIYEKLFGTFYKNYEIKNKISLLIIPYTQKEVEIQLVSSEPFKYFFSGGFSFNYDYYYNSNSNHIDAAKIDNNKYMSSITLHNLYRNLTLGNGGFFSFAINVDLDETKKIYLNYNQYSVIDDLMEEDISESFCKDVIKNFKDLFEIYVYTDIAKNPPDIIGHPNYHHEKIDIIERLNKISTKNRKFYYFYQDLQMIISAVKDLHLSITANLTSKGIKFGEFSVCLPFDFYVNESNSQYRIFIKKYNYCSNFYDKKIQNFIDQHLNIPIKRINKIDPFEYIQSWSKFRHLKNIHADFTSKISEISYFYLNSHPLNYSDLSFNEFEFDDDLVIIIPFHINRPIKSSLKFDNYFRNIMKKANSLNKIPSPDKIYNSFLYFKEVKKQNLKKIYQTKIAWDINLSHIEKYDEFKCRVDDINKVNVIYQNSFSFDFYDEAMGKMIQCAETFLNNNYPIIVIESKNGGGYLILYSILLQMLQPTIEFVDYRSYRVTAISETYFKTKKLGRLIDTFDCSEINSYNDFKIFYEDSYGDNSIHHNRTSPYDPLEIHLRLALKELREKFKKKAKYTRRPTDIIIFTDSFSYSATSGFIKGFQNTGGAVIVGYFGNPKIEGTELFDGSQSSSSVETLPGSQIKDNLIKYGFNIVRITTTESYNFHQKNVKDQIPREYALDPVDFRVNIYSDYSYDLYDKFIKEGIKIHKKLNEQNQCNSKNDKLFLHDDSCKKINGNSYTHGGYKCGSGNIWDKSICQPYYCDIGYYFDQVQKKCIANCRFDKEKSFFVYEDNYHESFSLQKNIKYYFMFPFSSSRFYFYKIIDRFQVKRKPVSTFGIIIEPKSYERQLEIEEIKSSSNINLLNLNNNKHKLSFIIESKSLLFIEFTEDFVLYLDNSYNNEKTELQLAEYNNEMTYDEMLNHDSKYFKSFKDNIHTFSKDKIYLLYVNLPELDPFNILLNPIYKEETIKIEGLETDILYLEKDKTYILDFKNNKINRLIKLSRETLKSEIVIENKNIILNSLKLYYQLENDYKGQLRLHIKNDNAIIEFLFKQNDADIDILDFNQKVFSLNKKYNILAIPKEYSSKLIDIELFRNEFITNFTIYLAYTIPPYNFFSVDVEENIFPVNEIFTFRVNEHYKGNFDIMENEYYCVMIENFGEDVTMSIEIKDDDGNDEKKEENEEDSGLEDWEIALITIASIIVVIALIILFYIIIKHNC